MSSVQYVTSSLTVAENRVFVLRTCGGCFSITNELWRNKKCRIITLCLSAQTAVGSFFPHFLTRDSRSMFSPSDSSGSMFIAPIPW